MQDRVTAYRRKISGPLIDRIDIHVEVLRPTTSQLRSSRSDGESSHAVRNRVAAARLHQQQRAGVSNAELVGDDFDTGCNVNNESWALLERAAERFNLSARAHQRILRVARTIADLADENEISPAHVVEALSLRCLDRQV